MNIIVIGAGTVGTSIADLLVREGHHLCVIDKNRERLQEISDMLDLTTVHGSGCSYEVLHHAGVEKAHLVLAMTENDEANLLASQLSRCLGAEKTVSRVRSREYLEPTRFNIG